MLTPERITHYMARLEDELTRAIDELAATNIGVARKDTLELRMRRINAARGRVRQGSYGLCCDCGDPFTDELEIDTTAPFCQYCQEDRSARRA